MHIQDIEPCYASNQSPDAACEAIALLPLDAVHAGGRFGPSSLRRALIHATAEYAARSGRADLLRERIDGRTRR